MKRENIVIIVMTTGEHIIGEKVGAFAVDNRDDIVVLENPVSIMPSPDPQQRGRLLFIPYLQFTDKISVEFPPHSYRHVLTDIKEDLRNNFAQQFGDGLQVPAEKGIILS